MSKKKASKKAAKPAETSEAEAPKEKKGEKVEAKVAHEPEQIVTRRGTTVGGTRAMTRSEYDKEIGKERASVVNKKK